MNKIYYDNDAGCLFVEGSDSVYPARALVVEAVSDNHVSIWHRDGSRRIVGPVRYDRLAEGDGSSFANQTAAVNYLEAEFKKNPYGFLSVTFVTILTNWTDLTLIDLF